MVTKTKKVSKLNGKSKKITKTKAPKVVEPKEVKEEVASEAGEEVKYF